MPPLDLALIGLLQQHPTVPSSPMARVTPVFVLEYCWAKDCSSQNIIRGSIYRLVSDTDNNRDGWNESASLDDLDDIEEDVTVEQELPYVFLEGEVIFSASGVSGRDLEDSVVFPHSVELIVNTTFTGEDLLAVGLEAGRAGDFSFVEEVTFEGQLEFLSDTDNGVLELSELSYELPLGDRTSLYLSVTGDDMEDFNPVVGDDALSEFGTEIPIHALMEDYGVQVTHEVLDDLELSLGYFTADASDPDIGLFKGNYSAFAQLGFEPSDAVSLGVTYIYTNNESSLATETGSTRSQLDLDRSVIGNSYGVSAAFAPSDRVAVGGWVGTTKARVLDLGDADIWNYALTLAFPDLGQEGNVLGFVFGQEPRLTGTSGFTVDDLTRDPDTSFHIEAFYRHQLSDRLSITPGLIWITAPDHDRSNPDIGLFTVKTTFEF